jgi:hypothetical protein
LQLGLLDFDLRQPIVAFLLYSIGPGYLQDSWADLNQLEDLHVAGILINAQGLELTLRLFKGAAGLEVSKVALPGDRPRHVRD